MYLVPSITKSLLRSNVLPKALVSSSSGVMVARSMSSQMASTSPAAAQQDAALMCDFLEYSFARMNARRSFANMDENWGLLRHYPTPVEVCDMIEQVKQDIAEHPRRVYHLSAYDESWGLDFYTKDEIKFLTDQAEQQSQQREARKGLEDKIQQCRGFE